MFQNEKAHFQAIKTRSSKSRKIDIFPKGLTHGFGPKMAIFPTFFFQAIQARKMSFTIFYNEKTPFQAIKTRSSKRQKIDIFPNGLTHGFGQKMAMYPTFFFRHYSLENVLYDILARKKPFKSIKKRRSKSRKIDIFQNGLTHRFGPKMTIFSSFFFLGNICQQNVFYDILEQKNAFLGYKNKNFRQSKN